MKKSMIKKLVVLVVVMVVAGGFAFGETSESNNSTDVVLNGTVATEMEIASSAAEVTFAIDPYLGYSGNLGVTLTAKSNHFGGYNVTATSVNEFKLDGDETQTPIAYTVDLGEQGSSYSQTSVSAVDGDSITFDVSVATAVDNPYESGTYTDTVTLTIASN